ncbi:MAG: tetratricopeptide repeat protein [Aureispira sp.]
MPTNNYAALIRLAEDYIEQGEFDLVVSTYEKAVLLQPDNHLLLFKLANYYVDLEDINKAIHTYHKALALQPDYYDALFNLGSTYADNKNLDKAILTYQKALKSCPNDYDTLISLAATYDENGATNKAILTYEKALLIQSEKETRNDLAWLYLVQSNFDKAILLWENNWKASATSDRHSSMNLGHCFLLQGDILQASIWYKRSKSLSKSFDFFSKFMQQDYLELNMETKGILAADFQTILTQIDANI